MYLDISRQIIENYYKYDSSKVSDLKKHCDNYVRLSEVSNELGSAINCENGHKGEREQHLEKSLINLYFSFLETFSDSTKYEDCLSHLKKSLGHPVSDDTIEHKCYQLSIERFIKG